MAADPQSAVPIRAFWEDNFQARERIERAKASAACVSERASLIAALRTRAAHGRLVAFECDFYALPERAQTALYGIAAELESAADEMERLHDTLREERRQRQAPEQIRGLINEAFGPIRKSLRHAR